MAMPWDDVISDTDREIFEVAGWGKRAGFGERPALLVIDVNYNFCGDKEEPVLDSIKKWRYACGPQAWHTGFPPSSESSLPAGRNACRSSTPPTRVAMTASTSGSGPSRATGPTTSST